MMYVTSFVSTCDDYYEKEEEKLYSEADKFAKKLKKEIDKRSRLILRHEVPSVTQWVKDSRQNRKTERAWKELRAEGLTRPDNLHSVLHLSPEQKVAVRQCHSCFEIFKSLKEKIKHVNDKERNYTEGQCNRCMEKFRFEIDLVLHMPWCGKSFAEMKEQLKSLRKSKLSMKYLTDGKKLRKIRNKRQ